jgi:hypothetical protein
MSAQRFPPRTASEGTAACHTSGTGSPTLDPVPRTGAITTSRFVRVGRLPNGLAFDGAFPWTTNNIDNTVRTFRRDLPIQKRLDALKGAQA